jgi:hypothetical protein
MMNDQLEGYAPQHVAEAILTVLVKHPYRLSNRPAFDAGLDLQDDVVAALQKFPRFRMPEPTPDVPTERRGFKKILT